MNRRLFIKHSTLFSASILTGGAYSTVKAGAKTIERLQTSSGLFALFQHPASRYAPFVRWWWNGNKVEASEIIRELRLLKDAGVGGVEINPIAFPSSGDDLGKKSLTWLGDEWINMLQVAFDEAKRLGMTCDLIVGSGWPFGAETLQGAERAQVVLVYAEKLEGPMMYEASRFHLFKAVDPGVTVPDPSRTFELLSLQVVPDPMSGLEQVVDFSDRCRDEVVRIEIPEGRHVLYALVKVDSFASVINGAPGAAGHILNHMNREVVRSYLDRMSDTIRKKTGALSKHLRAFFCDSMELEGCNWTDDLAETFRQRRGYDLMPYLPFILFKVGRLGAVVDDTYGAEKTPGFADILNRVRFDFELTKAELLRERFTETYLQWCREQGVQSRAQAYGRGFFPLESSLKFDIPEGESWTTNWLKHRPGEEMPDEDYRRGRAYTMINKFVSSAAHLTGKRVVSCEEMTNTYDVFNATLELLKIGSDHSIMSGVTHSVWHGFNYSPPDAPFPGWVQYGTYHNENNNWWPYVKYLNRYKARLSSVLMNADMYTDIAILPATYDLWSEMGVQTDPFPEKLNVPYTSLVWEAIHKNGGGADYTSEIVLRESTVRNGKLCYGSKAYGTLFLVEVSGINPEVLAKLDDFVADGGRIFCIEKYPEKSLGLQDFHERDRLVKQWVEKLKQHPDRFVLLRKPEDDRFLEWYREVMQQYRIPHYLDIEYPDRFVTQNRYRSDAHDELFFFANTHRNQSYTTNISFAAEITARRFPWVWDTETGERYRIHPEGNTITLELGPAETCLIVWSREKHGKPWHPLPTSGKEERTLDGVWEVELRHSREGWVKTYPMETLKDLKETEWVNFTGTAVYRRTFEADGRKDVCLNLGKVHGVCEVFLNGQSCGVKWYGRRIYALGPFLKKGINRLEVHVVTTMGNYMKTLKENLTAQKFTVLKSKDQPIRSMGLVGPVTMYIHS